jgi:hypothetical protein
LNTRKNPYSSRWDKSEIPIRLNLKDGLLLFAFDVLQTVLYYEGILIEMELALYMPALEIWSEKYPNYVNILAKTAVQSNESLGKSGDKPRFAIRFFLGIFEELAVMVNGVQSNNLPQLGNS